MVGIPGGGLGLVLLPNAGERLRLTVANTFGTCCIADIELDNLQQELQSIINSAVAIEASKTSTPLKDLVGEGFDVLEGRGIWRRPSTVQTSDVVKVLKRFSGACGLLSQVLEDDQSYHNSGKQPDEHYIWAQDLIVRQLDGSFRLLPSDEVLSFVAAMREGIKRLRSSSTIVALRIRERYENSRVKSGPKGTLWRPQYVDLLVKVCLCQGVLPTLGKDAVTKKPSGNLFRLASTMEDMLPVFMRTGNDGTFYKWLERAKGGSSLVNRQISSEEN